METDGRFCVVAFGRNQASVVFNIFFHIKFLFLRNVINVILHNAMC
jgi:hypothetical protein